MGEKFTFVFGRLRGAQQKTQTVWERRLSLVRTGESDHKWIEEEQEKHWFVIVNKFEKFKIFLTQRKIRRSVVSCDVIISAERTELVFQL